MLYLAAILRLLSGSGSGSGSRQYLAQFFNSHQIFTKSCLFNYRISYIYQKFVSLLISHFYSILCWIRFQLRFWNRNRNTSRFSGSAKARNLRFLRFRYHNYGFHSNISFYKQYYLDPLLLKYKLYIKSGSCLLTNCHSARIR